MNKKIISVVSIILVVAVMCTVLAACNAESVQKKLEKKDYEVQALTKEQIEKQFGEDTTIEWALLAEKSNGLTALPDIVSVVKFSKTDDAKTAEADSKKVSVEGYVVKRVGKIVYTGTEQGVKDAK